MIILATPVVDNHKLTQALFESLKKTVIKPKEFVFVIVDNNSEKKYNEKDYKANFAVKIIRNKENLGYYYPLKQLEELYPEAGYLGLVHNDVVFYEEGWDDRVEKEFNFDQRLGCIGFCGSWAIDRQGGRSYGTVCNFKGDRGQPQGLSGHRINDRKPSISLDSLFMLFRKETIATLGIDENIALCHFYDRIWTLREWKNGWHVIVLGILIDHMGGMTSCAPRYQEDAKKWCKKHGLPLIDGNGDLTIYKEAERRYKAEFAEYIPAIVDDNYNVRSHT